MREQSVTLKRIPLPSEVGRELSQVLARAAALRVLLRASKKIHATQTKAKEGVAAA